MAAKTITLINGHRLAYAEYGDPDGQPVFFFHGMPGSRFFRPDDEVTTRCHVRLVCVDRPGYGESTFQPGRRILDWPACIEQLANQLNLGKFDIAGHSGGGPYVAACAYALPGRVCAAAILSGAGPADAPDGTLGMAPANRLGISLGPVLPWPLWQALVWAVYRRRARDPLADMQRGNGQRPAADDDLLRMPEVREACIRSEIEAFRPGLRGLAWDAQLLTRPWGFSLEDIRVPTSLWHGTQDDQVPLAMARYVAGKIPNGKLIICENEGHLALFPHWKEILSQLVSE